MNRFTDQVRFTYVRHASLSVTAVAILSAISAQPCHAAANIIVVPPSALPASTREYSESMMLHETAGGRTYLYIEQQQGAKLTVLDVTDPIRIKAERTVTLAASGPFDFVTGLGTRAELIRYRGNGQEAVLDLHKAKAPTLDVLPELTVTGRATLLGEDGLMLTDRQNEILPATQYQIMDTAGRTPYEHIAVVKGVKQEITNSETGTTFLLGEEGLFVVRRPGVEASLEDVPTNSGG